jgi:hypothetical protein
MIPTYPLSSVVKWFVRDTLNLGPRTALHLWRNVYILRDHGVVVDPMSDGLTADMLLDHADYVHLGHEIWFLGDPTCNTIWCEDCRENILNLPWNQGMW